MEDSGEVVQHHDDRTAFADPRQYVLHQVRFGVLVHGGKGFVEDDHLRVADLWSFNPDQLEDREDLDKSTGLLGYFVEE